MNKKLVSSISIISILVVMTSPSVLGAEPTWALDPEQHAAHLADYVLLYEHETTFTDMYSQTTITGWFQFWGLPAGCNVSTCTGVLTIGYIESSTAIPDAALNPATMEQAMSQLGTGVVYEDITADVPGAKLAFTLNMTILTSSIMMGIAFFSGTEYAMFMTFDGVVPSSAGSDGLDISTSSAATTSDMQGLMAALGNAYPAGIPGYDLLIFLGLAGAISTVLIIRKRKRM